MRNANQENTGEIVIYQSEEGKAIIDVILQDETVWVTQDQMVALFGKAKSTISEHLKHIFDEGELDPNVVVRFSRTTTQHGAIEWPNSLPRRCPPPRRILSIIKYGECRKSDEE